MKQIIVCEHALARGLGACPQKIKVSEIQFRGHFVVHPTVIVAAMTLEKRINDHDFLVK